MEIFQRQSRKDAHRVVYEEPLYTQSELYHEASKINKETILGYRRHLSRIMGTNFFLKLMARPYKTYPACRTIALPAPGEIEGSSLSGALSQIVLKRRSTREFSGRPIPLNSIARIIFNAYGITTQLRAAERMRSVPSGGALYPLELYLAAFRLADLQPGVYHYNVEAHSLEQIRAGQFDEELGRAAFYEEMFKKVSAMLIITGILKRSSIKYGERAYRFMMLEAGHVGQNISLTAAALDLGCVMLGGFYDDEIDEIVGADGVSETTLYTAAIGALE